VNSHANENEYRRVAMDDVNYGVVALSSSFQMQRQQSQYSYCYLVERGDLEWEIYQPEVCRMRVPQGAIVAVSGLIPHVIRSAISSNEVLDLDPECIEPLTADGGEDTRLIVGRVKNDAITFAGAFLGLQIITPEKAPRIHWRIWNAYKLIEDELRDQEIGVEKTVRLLSETIMLNEMRFVQDSVVGQANVLGAVNDRRLIRSLLAIGRDPGRKWTIDDLAEVASMSRTAFASRFKSLLGVTPSEAVRYARLARSLYALENTAVSIEHISDSCGYSSAAAFVRAFQKEFGMTATRWRAEHGSPKASTN